MNKNKFYITLITIFLTLSACTQFNEVEVNEQNINDFIYFDYTSSTYKSTFDFFGSQYYTDYNVKIYPLDDSNQFNDVKIVFNNQSEERACKLSTSGAGACSFKLGPRTVNGPSILKITYSTGVVKTKNK